jgi:hypothetical protein
VDLPSIHSSLPGARPNAARAVTASAASQAAEITIQDGTVRVTRETEFGDDVMRGSE